MLITIRAAEFSEEMVPFDVSVVLQAHVLQQSAVPGIPLGVVVATHDEEPDCPGHVMQVLGNLYDAEQAIRDGVAEMRTESRAALEERFPPNTFIVDPDDGSLLRAIDLGY